MRTRCPACSTTFRVTSEQLRLKAGKVRCGQCLAVFNAFESLIEEDQPAAKETPLPAAPPPSPKRVAPTPLPVAASEKDSLEPPEPILAAIQEIEKQIDTSHPLEENPADATQAAREAGLVAARELSETTAHNRWAAGTLASDAHNRFDPAEPEQATWPFVLAACVLFTLLLAQLLYYFRSDLVQRLPEMSNIYALAAVDVPLPRNSELVGIDVSDLQADNARGLLVLQATLRNRAHYAQAWPALELTLTDTQDQVISRRVLPAAEYLPPGTPAQSFRGRSELAIKLWLEAKGVGASGYRLYLFYP